MKRRKRFAILIGVAAAGVMALGAQTGAQTPAPRGQAPVTCFPNSHKPATIVGTSGNDTLSGTPANDVIASRGGNDKVSGLGGNDLICGGPGKDTLKGGKGDDELLGQHGPDTLKGGDGKDDCVGGEQGDTVSKCEYGQPPGARPSGRAAGVMALGAQTASSTTGESVDSTPPDLQLSGPKKQSPQKTAGAKKGCGLFQGFTGLRSIWSVVVNRGKVSCKTAGEVMRKLFRKGPNRTIGKWDCIGPQTGFARCDYGNRRITAHDHTRQVGTTRSPRLSG